MNQAWETLFAVLALTGLVVLIPLLFWALVDRRPQGPDVGLAVFVEDQTCDDGCEDCGAPMAIPDQDHFDDYGIELTEYGQHLVHRHCLMARRDGLTACADCARVMVGAA